MSDILKKITKTESGNFRVPGRISYPTVFTPKAQSDQPGAKLKYSCALLIPPGVDLTELKAAATAKAKETLGAKAAGCKSPFLNPLEKGYDEEFKGWTLLRMSSDMKPDIVGPNPKDHIEEPREVYPGRWARISTNPYAYNKNGNKGVTFGLNNIQLLDHDEPIAGGRTRAEDDFEAVEVASGGAKTGAADDVFA